MRAGLPVQNKSVPGQRRDQFASRQTAQVRVVDRRASDNYGHLRFPGDVLGSNGSVIPTGHRGSRPRSASWISASPSESSTWPEI